MTAETRAYAQRLLPTRSSKALTYKPNIGTLMLAIIVMLSGLAVVYVSDLNRRVFMEVQAGQGYQNQLHLDWGKLLLEESTWSTQARIQSLAEERLEMAAPNTGQIVMIKET